MRGIDCCTADQVPLMPYPYVTQTSQDCSAPDFVFNLFVSQMMYIVAIQQDLLPPLAGLRPRRRPC
jgi:hypothetical protein